MMIRLWTEDPPYEIKGKYWQAVVKENVLPDLGVGKMTYPTSGLIRRSCCPR